MIDSFTITVALLLVHTVFSDEYENCFDFSHGHLHDHVPILQWTVYPSTISFNLSIPHLDGYIALGFNEMNHVYKNADVIAAWKEGPMAVVKQYKGDSTYERADFQLINDSEITGANFVETELFVHLTFTLPQEGTYFKFADEETRILLLHDDTTPTGNELHDNDDVHVDVVNFFESYSCEDSHDDDHGEEREGGNVTKFVEEVRGGVIAFFVIGLILVSVAVLVLVFTVVVLVIAKVGNVGKKGGTEHLRLQEMDQDQVVKE